MVKVFYFKWWQRAYLLRGSLLRLTIRSRSRRKLCKSGQLIRTGRGLYVLVDGNFTEHHSLAEAGKRVPDGIICLLSALSYHEIGTQL